MENLEGLTPLELRAYLIRKIQEQDWWEVGRVLVEIKEKKLYKEWNYETFLDFYSSIQIKKPRFLRRCMQFYRKFKDNEMIRKAKLSGHEITNLLKLNKREINKIKTLDNINEQIENILHNKKFKMCFVFNADEMFIVTSALEAGKDVNNLWDNNDIIVLACLEFLANVQFTREDVFKALIQTIERLFNVEIEVKKTTNFPVKRLINQ